MFDEQGRQGMAQQPQGAGGVRPSQPTCAQQSSPCRSVTRAGLWGTFLTLLLHCIVSVYMSFIIGSTVMQDLVLMAQKGLQ